MRKYLNGIWILVVSLLFSLTSTDVMAKGGFVELDGSFNEFSNIINNPWWPLAEGTEFIYMAETEDECVVDVVTVLYPGDQSRMSVDGIKIREVLDEEFLDEDCDGGTDELLETTLDWYAQDVNGVIWYFGEYSLSFDFEEGECDGDLVATPDGMGCPDGSWEAGADVADTGMDAEEGIIMLTSPEKGQFYFQEFYEDEAEDMAKILNFKTVDTFIDGEVEDCLVTKEWVPLEPGEVEHKYYCYGIGLVLIEGNAGGKTVFEDLVEVNHFDP